VPKSSFDGAVKHVVGRSTEKQVRRIEAEPVIACVADRLACRRDAVKGGKRDAMSSEEVSLAIDPLAHLPVSGLRVYGIRPLPAPINSLKRTRYRPHPALRGTVVLNAGAGDKHLAATIANPGDDALFSVLGHCAIIAKLSETAEEIAARL
jgi:hypothetical protein